jgi:hypothetical protein
MRLRARSSRPKQQNRRARPLRFLGVRPSYGLCSLVEELDDEDGLSGMVALTKMRESCLRCLVGSTSVRGDELSEYGESVVGVCDSGEKVVLIGESIGRFARGEVGRP